MVFAEVIPEPCRELLDWLVKSRSLEKPVQSNLSPAQGLGDGLQEVGSSADSQLDFVVLTPSFTGKIYGRQRTLSSERLLRNQKDRKIAVFAVYNSMLNTGQLPPFFPGTSNLCIDLMWSLCLLKDPEPGLHGAWPPQLCLLMLFSVSTHGLSTFPLSGLPHPVPQRCPG